MDYYFETKGFSVGYAGCALIRDISIGIKKGEIVALIGPNGSGKSTILKSIARQLKAIAGCAYLDREDLKRLPAKVLSQKMAVVLTERIRLELLTCRDIVATGRYPYTGRLGILGAKDNAKVDEALCIVGARTLGERDFNTLSDGQRQRVLLARALCQEPEILLLDEPTSFLDIHYKLELLGILRKMAREKGITVLVSLHEIDLAEKLADRVLCVKGETIAGFGAPEDVFQEEAIRALYDMQQGYYDPLLGSVELARVSGRPRVFVLSACGSGIAVYRALQREGIPFCAGILYTNDVDYRVARLLAVDVVQEEAFCEISDAAWARAVEMLDACETMLDAGIPIGACNRRIVQLIDRAKDAGKYRAAREYLDIISG